MTPKMTTCLISIYFAAIFLSAVVNGDYLGRLCGTNWGHKGHSYNTTGSQVKECIEFCHDNGNMYAGLLDGTQCLCDDTIYYPTCRDYSTESICSDTRNCSVTTGIPCEADPTMICGDTIWFSLYDAGPLWRTIWNWDTKVNDVCSRESSTCEWKCAISDTTYAYQHGSVFGTVNYGIKSSYCLAAAHDLRFVPNTETEVTMSRQTSIQQEWIQGSWQHGINSGWDYTSHTFIFTSPARNYDFSTSVLWAFVDMNARVLNCVKYPATADTTILAANLAGVLQDKVTNLPLVDNTIFYCGLQRGSVNRVPATYVPAVTQPQGHEGAVMYSTVTVVEGNGVTFNFTTTGIIGGPFTVQKQAHIVVNASSKSVMTVSKGATTLQDGGFYRLITAGGAIAARIRLIIVPGGTVLDKCCGFRGIPREDNTCLCVPPFGNAADCSDVCNPHVLDGTFGPHCDMNCGTNNCKGMLICGQDPYGCHCPSGWYGGDCNTPCPEGTWGPDCIGHASGCHCINGVGCNRVTGDCPMGCEWGWFGTSCTKQGPYVETAPYINKTGSDWMYVCWNLWVHGKEPGDVGPPDGYYLNIADANHLTYKNESGKLANSVFCFNATQLVHDLVYYFRVQTSYAGHVMPWASYNVSGSLNCGKPTAPVSSLTGVPGNDAITVNWVWPPKPTWNCDTTTLHCDYACTYQCGTEYVRQSFNIKDTTTVTHTVSVPKYASCNFDCFLTNGPNLNGPQAVTGEVNPIATPPGPILNFDSYSAIAGLVLVWSTPTYEDGHISGYRVEVVNQGWTNFTQLHTFTYTAATLGSSYTIKITAQNSVGWGAVFQKTVIYDIPA